MDAAPEAGIELFHGYTYSGCPVASAAAIATRDIFEQEQLVERAAKISPKFLEALYSLKDLPFFVYILVYFLICVLDLAPLPKPVGLGLNLLPDFYDAACFLILTLFFPLSSPPLFSSVSTLYSIF